ncbi:MAG: NYN domain-containing protein [Ilumatobacteraceae bacterium]
MAKHVVVDGSNLATEGRTAPSLKQLNEAVLAFMTEYPDTKVTVVVDASFGHRIDKKEVAEFNSAIDNNELVSPPAGAVGRGDGFVLTIAEKVGASVLSNDSYQEFHQQYKWLFDPGRLIGGKPVPLVGWVFIERLPVRVSANRDSASIGRKSAATKIKKASREAQRPMPIPKSPPPGARVAPKMKLPTPAIKVTTTAKHLVSKQLVSKHTAAKQATSKQTTPKLHLVKQQAPKQQAPKPQIPKQNAKASAINELAPFLDFVEHHPVGSKVKGVVDTYSAHGVYVRIGDIRGYLPLQLMANPVPRSAREHVTLGQQVSLVVASFTPSRRSIEVGIVGVVSSTTRAQMLPSSGVAKKSRKRSAVTPIRKAPARKK